MAGVARPRERAPAVGTAPDGSAAQRARAGARRGDRARHGRVCRGAAAHRCVCRRRAGDRRAGGGRRAEAADRARGLPAGDRRASASRRRSPKPRRSSPSRRRPSSRAFEKLARAIGPPAAVGLLSAYQREDGGLGADRATALLVKFGPPAIPVLAGAIESAKWHVQREIARVLGADRDGRGRAAATSPAAAGDVRVMQAAVGVDGAHRRPVGAARAAHGVEGDDRRGPGRRDRRAGRPEGRPRGPDARAHRAGERSVQRGFPAPARNAERAVVDPRRRRGGANRGARAQTPLAGVGPDPRSCARLRCGPWPRIGTPKARQTLDDLSKNGDFFLRRMAAAAAAKDEA